MSVQSVFQTNNLITHIDTFLPIQDIANSAGVNRLFNKCAQQPVLQSGITGITQRIDSTGSNPLRQLSLIMNCRATKCFGMANDNAQISHRTESIFGIDIDNPKYFRIPFASLVGKHLIHVDHVTNIPKKAQKMYMYLHEFAESYVLEFFITNRQTQQTETCLLYKSGTGSSLIGYSKPLKDAPDVIQQFGQIFEGTHPQFELYDNQLIEANRKQAADQ